MKHEPLTLIHPAFEAPLPPLRPAVFPPSLRELPSPALDLFDLDEQFASEEVRLAHLTNRCNNNDIDYYIKRCGEIFVINTRIKDQSPTAKQILDVVFKQLTQLKKTNIDNFSATLRMQHTQATSGQTTSKYSTVSKPPTPISSPNHS